MAIIGFGGAGEGVLQVTEEPHEILQRVQTAANQRMTLSFGDANTVMMQGWINVTAADGGRLAVQTSSIAYVGV